MRPQAPLRSPPTCVIQFFTILASLLSAEQINRIKIGVVFPWGLTAIRPLTAVYPPKWTINLGGHTGDS